MEFGTRTFMLKHVGAWLTKPYRNPVTEHHMQVVHPSHTTSHFTVMTVSIDDLSRTMKSPAGTPSSAPSGESSKARCPELLHYSISTKTIRTSFLTWRNMDIILLSSGKNNNMKYTQLWFHEQLHSKWNPDILYETEPVGCAGITQPPAEACAPFTPHCWCAHP